jgi:hypothetical protein
MSFAVLGVGGTIAAVGTLGSLGIGAASLAQGKKAQNKAQEELERQAKNSPIYKPSKEINQYYQEALNRYKQSPLQSQEYLLGKSNIEGAAASGLAALQDRRAGIGGVSRLAANRMNALRNLSAQAESRKMQDLSRVGQAAQMQAGQAAQEFDINKMTPYNRQLQLEQLKAQAGGEQYNAGMQMIGSGLSNAAAYGINYANANPTVGRQARLGKQFNTNNANIKRMIGTVPYVGD